LAAALDSFGLMQKFDSSTRGENLLDILASSDPLAVFGARVCEVSRLPNHRLVVGARVREDGLLSDHCLVVARLAARRLKQKVGYRSRNIKAIDPCEFEWELRASSLFTSPSDTVDRYVDQLTAVVTTSLQNKFAPLRIGIHRASKKSSSWLSKEAIDAKRERR
jgi:hypothetical protein